MQQTCWCLGPRPGHQQSHVRTQLQRSHPAQDLARHQFARRLDRTASAVTAKTQETLPATSWPQENPGNACVGRWRTLRRRLTMPDHPVQLTLEGVCTGGLSLVPQVRRRPPSRLWDQIRASCRALLLRRCAACCVIPDRFGLPGSSKLAGAVGRRRKRRRQDRPRCGRLRA